MAKAVVILGAGSSADFGVPTLRRIFKDPVAQSYLLQNQPLHEQIRRVFWEPRGYALQTSDQSLTIEEMLTILRDWEQERCPQPREDFGEFRRQLYVLIYKAVFERKSSRGQHLNPLIRKCDSKLEQVTWASFNWDCIFEASFWYQSGKPGPYGGRHNPNLVVDLAGWRRGHGKHEYLKLHGSINWWVIGDKATYLSFGGWQNELAPKWNEYAQKACGGDFPIILEPSAYKYHDVPYGFLEPQWQRFFERLCDADFVIIVGYSLPEADVQARSKILTAFQSNPRSRWLIIDPTADVCARYRRLLGEQRVTIMDGITLTGFNNDLETGLQIAFPDINWSEPAPAATAPTTS